MDFYSHVGSSNHFSQMPNASEFRTEAYMEYRRRVFEQLAAEYDKEKSSEKVNQNEMTTDQLIDLSADHHTLPSTQNGTNFNEMQPTWDDSDLQTETYAFSQSQDVDNNSCIWEFTRVDNLHSMSSSNSENNLELAKQSHNPPLMNWSSFDKHLKLMASKQSNFEITDNLSFNSDQWKEKKSNPLQEQKLEREAIRRKLSMGDSNDEDDEMNLEKPWLKTNRTFTANSQSLHLCYINEPCSSDSSDEDTSRPSPSAFSPLSSPGFSSGMLSRKQKRGHFSSEPTSSLHSSPRVSSTSPNAEGSSGRKQSRQEELEMEARFELAQAQRKARLQAEEEKRKGDRHRKTSLAHRLLSDILPENTASKMKSYSLSMSDCKNMSVGQLQLILNDMHTKKQALNEELMSLLIVRDDLQIEQDAKLVDIEDAKTLIGPETTV